MDNMCFSNHAQNLNLDFNGNILESSLDLQNIDDEDLIEAVCRSVESGNIRPIIKRELQYFVQARRLADGKDELSVKFTPPVKSQLGPQDEEKVGRRREQNRRAAQKFRAKSRNKRSSLDEELQRQQQRNTELVERVNYLNKEVLHFRLKVRRIMEAVCLRSREIRDPIPPQNQENEDIP